MAKKSVCVFCGSKEGADNRFVQLARELGKALALENAQLVYGGAQIGIMGAVADAVLEEGGEVIGVIPEALSDREVAHPGLTELIVTSNMHERKRRMYALADAFVALPGGMGTLEEVFEAATWTKLRMHEPDIYKPVVLLDDGQFWDPLSDFLNSLVGYGFVSQKNRGIVISASSVSETVSVIREILEGTD